ncbi:hypothetical protein BJV77DRAFT_1159165 [Russula vinacea]|nr:hypothetical protein BJV77DRAFT_1159165 [Russula vinacea]
MIIARRFPNPVPAGTSVPLWALIDVTVEGTWDPTLALKLEIPPKEVPARSYKSNSSLNILIKHSDRLSSTDLPTA